MQQKNDQLNKQTNPQDYYQYKDHPSWFTRLLWHSAGADAQLLMRSPASDRFKYQGLGGVVLATAMIAFISGSYAFYVVFGPKSDMAVHDVQTDLTSALASVLFGSIWALIIYNLDRFIVGSSGKNEQDGEIGFKDLWTALPRILMALIIGVCLSKPLEIRILKTEIDSRLAEIQEDKRQADNAKTDKDYEEHFARIDTAMSQLETEINKIEESSEARRVEKVKFIDALNAELTDIKNKRQETIKQRDTEINNEVSGERSGIPGVGKRVQYMQEALEKYKQESDIEIASRSKINDEVISRKNSDYEDFIKRQRKIHNVKVERIKVLQSQKEDYLKEREQKRTENAMKAKKLDGLMKRIQIADEIGGNIPFAIMILLLAIEICPIFFKMLLIKSPYDYLKENQELLALANFGIVPETPKLMNGNVEITSPMYHAPVNAIELEIMRLEIEKEMNVKSLHNQKNI